MNRNGRMTFGMKKKRFETVVITGDTMTLERKAFIGCIHLTNVIFLGDTLTVEQDVFKDCSELKKIKLKTHFDTSQISIEIKQKIFKQENVEKINQQVIYSFCYTFINNSIFSTETFSIFRT